MTEQEITPCEFVAGLCRSCGASEQLGCEGWLAPEDRVQSLSDQVEALKKERDEWLARHAECCRLMGECMQDRADMATERDTLALEVDQWRVDFHELSLERDALQKQVDKLSSWEGGGVEVSLNAWKAAQADAARYQWLRRTATKLSFDNVLIGSLVRDQSELDGAIKEAGVQ